MKVDTGEDGEYGGDEGTTKANKKCSLVEYSIV